VGHGDSMNIMGALERRALVSHKQEVLWNSFKS
jgi:hypothetical protein